MSFPLNKIGWGPPTASLVLLGVIAVSGGSKTTIPTEVVRGYMNEVGDMVDAVPSQIGDWIGTDSAPPPPALRMLRPNRILQRRYTNLETDEWFEFLIVHCGDVQDMGAHYPPRCYPAHGWTLVDTEPAELHVGTMTIDAMSYDFERASGLRDEGITIVSTFAVPHPDEDKRYGPDQVEMLGQAGRYRERARLGAGQIQVITPSTMTESRREEIVAMCAAMLEDVFERIGEGVK